ncbi:MAG TPA: hypothetical protein VGH62_04365 [Bradyrhizobium sp.]
MLRIEEIIQTDGSDDGERRRQNEIAGGERHNRYQDQIDESRAREIKIELNASIRDRGQGNGPRQVVRQCEP